MERIQANQKSDTDTDTEAVHASARDAKDEPLRKRRRTSTTGRKNEERGGNKMKSATTGSVQPKIRKHKIHQTRNVRFTKQINEAEADHIEVETDQAPLTTQIRTVFQELVVALDGKTGLEEAQKPPPNEDDGTLDERQSQTLGSLTSKATIAQPKPKANRNPHLKNTRNTSDTPTPQQHPTTNHVPTQASTETPLADDISTPNPRQAQNARVAAIVHWAQRNRIYNPTATLVHPFNLNPPAQTHPFPLAQHEFIRPTVEPLLSSRPHPPAPPPAPSPLSPLGNRTSYDSTALYEHHPAYAHLTPEQRIQVQRLVEKEGRKTALDRRFELVEAELDLSRAGMWGDEEARREKREILECLVEEMEGHLQEEGDAGWG